MNIIAIIYKYKVFELCVPKDARVSDLDPFVETLVKSEYFHARLRVRIVGGLEA